MGKKTLMARYLDLSFSCPVHKGAGFVVLTGLESSQGGFIYYLFKLAGKEGERAFFYASIEISRQQL